MNKNDKKRLYLSRSILLLESYDNGTNIENIVTKLQEKVNQIPDLSQTYISFDYDDYDENITISACWSSEETDEEYNERLEKIIKSEKIDKEITKIKEEKLLRRLMKKYPKIVAENNET